MGLKRLLLIVVLVLAASVAVVSDAPAGDFADDPCTAISGASPETYLCPGGKVAVPYSMKFKLKEGSGCGPETEIFKVSSGNFPPGLTLASEGNISGTPTQAGSFEFYVEVTYSGCTHVPSDRRFRIVIAPETPRLILQVPAVPISTVGAPFSLQLGASLPEPKTWTVVDGLGTLPPGLQLGSSDGLLSGTPTTAGTYPFAVHAVLTTDTLVSPPRADQTTMQIVVRDPVTIQASEPFVTGTRTKWEVGVPFAATLAATGGTATTYTWALTSGALPAGVLLGTDGTITGTPRAAGISSFAVTATDEEGRAGVFPAAITVAAKLAIVARPLPSGKVGKRYKARVKTTGGVLPRTWRLKTGPLPRGIRWDRTLGVFAGTPTKAGRYRVTVEATDELGVKVTRTFTIFVKAAPVTKKRR